MYYNDYCNLKMRNKPRVRKNQQNFDLLHKLRKMNIPYFDRSDRCTSRAWVHKLETYFQLNPMMEEEEIKFSTLPLDGKAHEWWYHGLLTLGNSNITSYEDFTQRMMDRFDRKYLDNDLRELAQLRKTSTPKDYVIEFQRMEVMVTNIYENRLLMLSMEGLDEPLRGWVRDFRPNKLQQSIVKNQDMVDIVPKKTSTKKFIP